MRPVVVNPGAEALANTSRVDAAENMVRFAQQLGEGWAVAPLGYDGRDGRYPFILWKGGHCWIIDMPGWPYERVAYTGAAGQNIWHYPRLYVDGGSWVWKFAISIVRDAELASRELHSL